MNAQLKHDPRILFVCACCDEFIKDESPARPREDIAIMPDGTWLCDECYSECDKLEYGFPDPHNRDENYEHPEFEDLPRPQLVLVPNDDWQAVPRQPTQEMMDAGLYQSSADAEWADVYSSWVDMVAAAPSDGDDPTPALERPIVSIQMKTMKLCAEIANGIAEKYERERSSLAHKEGEARKAAMSAGAEAVEAAISAMIAALSTSPSGEAQ